MSLTCSNSARACKGLDGIPVRKAQQIAETLSDFLDALTAAWKMPAMLNTCRVWTRPVAVLLSITYPG